MGNCSWTKKALALSFSASQEATGFPAENLADYHPNPLILPWRSVNTSGPTVTVNFASSTVRMLAFGGANFPTLTVTSGGSPIPGSPFTMTKWYNFRRACSIVSFVSSSIELAPSGTPDDGASFYQLGYVWVSDEINELPVNPFAPMQSTLDGDYLENEYDTLVLKPPYLTEEWQSQYTNTQWQAQIRALVSLPKNTDLLWFENFDEPAAVKVMRPLGGVRFQRIQGLQYEVNPAFKEWV